jgi:hypothetical protein
MRTFIVAGAFLIALTLSAGTALAAAFCVVGTSIPPQCMYDDIQTCNASSTPPESYCDVNPATTLKYFGSQRYCAVDSNLQAQCLYNSRILCQSTLGGQAVICIDRGETPDDISPFRYDSRTQE